MAIITLARGAFCGARELAQYISESLATGSYPGRHHCKNRTVRDVKEQARACASQRLGVLPRMDLEWIHYRVYAEQP